MARKALRPCKHPGCQEVTRIGWCKTHQPPTRKSRKKESAEYHKWYGKAVWTKSMRPAQLLREPWCRVCAASGIRTRATVVDHVIPFRGDWNLFASQSNHQSLCKFHHDQKTAKEQAEKAI